MNDLEITFCIFTYLVFGVLTDVSIVAPYIKEYNETKTKKFSLPLIIIILFVILFTYPLFIIIVLVKIMIDSLKKYFNLD